MHSVSEARRGVANAIPPQSMFVYGTLRRDMGYPLLTPHDPISMGHGKIRGRMHSLGGYPGVLPNQSGTVTGELLSYEHLDEDEWKAVLSTVDTYEGSGFDRHMVTVAINGVESEAWVYYPNNPMWLSGFPIVPSGDWKEWRS